MSDIVTGTAHSFNADLLEWAKDSSLDENTLHVLGENGFTTLALLEYLGPEDIMKYFYESERLKLAQRLVLTAALQKLKNEEIKQTQPTETQQLKKEIRNENTPELELLKMIDKHKKMETCTNLAMPFVSAAANLAGTLLSNKIGQEKAQIRELTAECSYTPDLLQVRCRPKPFVKILYPIFSWASNPYMKDFKIFSSWPPTFSMNDLERFSPWTPTTSMDRMFPGRSFLTRNFLKDAQHVTTALRFLKRM